MGSQAHEELEGQIALTVRAAEARLTAELSESHEGRMRAFAARHGIELGPGDCGGGGDDGGGGDGGGGGGGGGGADDVDFSETITEAQPNITTAALDTTAGNFVTTAHSEAAAAAAMFAVKAAIAAKRAGAIPTPLNTSGEYGDSFSRVDSIAAGHKHLQAGEWMPPPPTSAFSAYTGVGASGGTAAARAGTQQQQQQQSAQSRKRPRSVKIEPFEASSFDPQHKGYQKPEMTYRNQKVQ